MKKTRYVMKSETSEYHKGYADGIKAAFDESELDAYYTGVGYGKKASGDKHIGFNNDDERRSFEAGVKNNSKHFRAYRAEPPTFFERIFFGIKVKKENSTGSYQNKKNKYTKKRLNKNRRKFKKYARS